jgi:GntR family transcriptional repressor for pyruvate dehydrogenase complex
MRSRSTPARQRDRSKRAPITLEAVHGARIYENVVAQLQQLVLDGRLAPGDKLPSERELCTMLQVGRSSIRDAIRHLQTLGVVRSRHGGGTVVQDLSPESLVTPLATMLTRRGAMVEELMDVRAIIEPALAARAAVRASREDLDRLRALVRHQEQRLRAGELSIDEDAEFHAIIAHAAGNRVMLSVLDVLLGLLAETRSRALQGRGRTVRSANAHRRIVRALERRSPAAAEKAMKDHLRGIGEVIARKLRGANDGSAGAPAPAPRPRRRRAARR